MRGGSSRAILAAWSLLTVLIGLTLWYVAVPWVTPPHKPADFEAVAAVLTSIKARYGQAPGPAERHLAAARSLEAQAPNALDHEERALLLHELAMLYRKAVAVDPERPEAWLGLARTALAQADDPVVPLSAQQGVQIAAALGQLDPDAPRARLVGAWLLTGVGRLGEALTLLDGADVEGSGTARWLRGQLGVGGCPEVVPAQDLADLPRVPEPWWADDPSIAPPPALALARAQLAGLELALADERLDRAWTHLSLAGAIAPGLVEVSAAQAHLLLRRGDLRRPEGRLIDAPVDTDGGAAEPGAVAADLRERAAHMGRGRRFERWAAESLAARLVGEPPPPRPAVLGQLCPLPRGAEGIYGMVSPPR